MNTHAAAPLILSIRSLRKERAQGAGAAYTLSVPRLDVRHGEKLLITGPSGCGKSTLLDIIGLALRPDTVRSFVFFPEARDLADGSGVSRPPVAGWTHSNIRPAEADRPRNVAAAWHKGDVERLTLWRRHVGYVLQTGGLLPFISVRDNIRLLDPSGSGNFAALPDKLALTLGIRHLLPKFPAQLSVGERQRVAIARALAANPPLVLADEPTAALDPVNAATVLALFSRMVDELGSTLILVSHAPEQMRGMGFRRLWVRLQAMAKDGETGAGAILSEEDLPAIPGKSGLPDDSADMLPARLPAEGDTREAGGGACPC